MFRPDCENSRLMSRAERKRSEAGCLAHSFAASHLPGDSALCRQMAAHPGCVGRVKGYGWLTVARMHTLIRAVVYPAGAREGGSQGGRE